MALTPAQLTTLKAFITADPELSPYPHDPDGAFAVAALLNQTATPDFWVWRTNVTMAEVMLNNFDWTRVDNLSVGPARVWEWMFGVTGSIDPSKPNVRAGIIQVWKGVAADLAVRLVVFGHCQKLASKVEKLFATGSGTPVVVDGTGPATMAVVSPISYQDVQNAWAS